MDESFEVVKEGNKLLVQLNYELSVANAPALIQEFSKYYGQGIEEVVFDVTGLQLLTSAGIRAIAYANQRLGIKNQIVAVNCAKEIYNVLDHVGMARIIRFEESEEKKKKFRMKYLGDKKIDEVRKFADDRKKALEDFSSPPSSTPTSRRIWECSTRPKNCCSRPQSIESAICLGSNRRSSSMNSWSLCMKNEGRVNKPSR